MQLFAGYYTARLHSHQVGEWVRRVVMRMVYNQAKSYLQFDLL